MKKKTKLMPFGCSNTVVCLILTPRCCRSRYDMPRSLLRVQLALFRDISFRARHSRLLLETIRSNLLVLFFFQMQPWDTTDKASMMQWQKQRSDAFRRYLPSTTK